MRICKHAVVTGKVQGVFYRQNTQNKAQSLGVTGWVRNLPNGTVECVLCGEEEDVNALCDWLWLGPDVAQVTDVKIKDHALEAFSEFSIRY